ncbi:hypothetical protein NGA_0648900, partial [Nannochloropsis gaditana CCMP526]|uniref:uncharacterized protein n=1 Tax=Nannochloropsis gaditana (strain CCMP526) TaxID=1093141 RepID=UPI00029F6544
AKRQEARLATAILSLQQQGSRARKVRSPVKQGVRRAGENRRSKFVKSVSLKRQALYGKNRVQEARESGERKVEGTDE